MSALAIGDAIPAAKLIDADGATIDLASLKGAPLIVYFYPKADTPGCTVEAQDFTRLSPDFAHLGAHVVAVSRDRKSVVEGKSVSVRVDLGGRRIINKKSVKIVT